MPPEEAVTSPEERMMRDFPPTPNDAALQEAARKRQPPQRDPMAGLGIPGPQVPGGQPQPGFFPPGQQGPPDPMAGLRGPPGPEPMGIPPMPPMTPGVPGGAEQPGFFPPQGSWGDTMVDQQRAKVARDAARNPPPQSPYNPLPGNNQPPGPGAGPPNPFAGLGDAFGAPSQAAIDQFAGGAGAVAPAPGQPQGRRHDAWRPAQAATATPGASALLWHRPPATGAPRASSALCRCGRPTCAAPTPRLYRHARRGQGGRQAGAERAGRHGRPHQSRRAGRGPWRVHGGCCRASTTGTAGRAGRINAAIRCPYP